MRMLTSRAHGFSPFFIIYKQEPLIPGRPLTVDDRFPLKWDSTNQEEVQYTEALVKLFWEVRAAVSQRLDDTDRRMKKEHDARTELLDEELEPGDIIVRQQRKIGKLIPRSEGPYTFVKYANAAKTSGIIDVGGKHKKVHCSLLRKLVD